MADLSMFLIKIEFMNKIIQIWTSVQWSKWLAFVGLDKCLWPGEKRGRKKPPSLFERLFPRPFGLFLVVPASGFWKWPNSFQNKVLSFWNCVLFWWLSFLVLHTRTTWRFVFDILIGRSMSVIFSYGNMTVRKAAITEKNQQKQQQNIGA